MLAVLTASSCCSPCTAQTNAIRAGLINATRAGLKLPDSVYLMNVWDEAWCYSYAGGRASMQTLQAPMRKDAVSPALHLRYRYRSQGHGQRAAVPP